MPRKIARADGWTADVQRNFIAALAYTGSARRACAAVGKAQFGADQLRRAKGNESFLAAWDKALAIFKDRSHGRLAAGLGIVHREHAAWAPAAGPWSGAASRQILPGTGSGAAGTAGEGAPGSAPTSDDTPEARRAWLFELVRKYLIKVEQERTARLAGRIVEADFYVRQITWLEVAADLLSSDGFMLLCEFRAGGGHLIDIAETPLSRILGEARRTKWAELGEPARPDHPPRGRLVDLGRFSTEPSEATRGGLPLSHEEQRRAFDEQHVRDAAAQIEWEEKARADAAAWRARLEAEGSGESSDPGADT